MRRLKYKKARTIKSNFFEYTGIYKTDKVCMQLFAYNDEGYEEYENTNLQKLESELHDKSQEKDVFWFNIHGLHEVDLIRETGKLLNIEDSIVSDILNTQRRSRMEELGDILFFSIKSVLQEDPNDNLRIEQISFLMKDNLLVSFQERKSDFFSTIRSRIRERSGNVRKKRNDYLLYLLLDAVMDNFFITLENYEDKIETLLIQSKANHDSEFLIHIERNRENLNFLRRAIVPLRDALYSLKSIGKDDDFKGIEDSNYTYFARLHQKSLELLEQIENDINAIESASSIFFSSQNQRMNQIMKTLTVVSVIFMPLTFIVGVYGMNFDNMPELRTKNGYFEIWGIMILLVLAMIFYFKKKKWF